MNNDDERDYAEEAHNARILRTGDGERDEMEDTMIVIEGAAVAYLRRIFVQEYLAHGNMSHVYKVRVCKDEGTVKIKVNEGMWSQPYA